MLPFNSQTGSQASPTAPPRPHIRAVRDPRTGKLVVGYPIQRGLPCFICNHYLMPGSSEALIFPDGRISHRSCRPVLKGKSQLVPNPQTGKLMVQHHVEHFCMACNQLIDGSTPAAEVVSEHGMEGMVHSACCGQLYKECVVCGLLLDGSIPATEVILDHGITGMIHIVCTPSLNRNIPGRRSSASF